VHFLKSIGFGPLQKAKRLNVCQTLTIVNAGFCGKAGFQLGENVKGGITFPLVPRPNFLRKYMGEVEEQSISIALFDFC